MWGLWESDTALETYRRETHTWNENEIYRDGLMAFHDNRGTLTRLHGKNQSLKQGMDL